MTVTPEEQQTGSAPSLAQLAPVLDAGGPALVDLLARTERRLAEVADGFGQTLGTHTAGTLAAGGKRLRPTLVFLAGGCAAGEPAPGRAEAERLVSAGAAVELLHMATLIHDDVLDNASLRRGHPTIFSTAGREAATATGDFLFSRAFAELAATAEAGAVRALSDAASALARGELLQREDAWAAEVSEERYLLRCELKTARLFAAACRMGALLGAPGPAAAGPLAEFGRRIGIAFQLFDDVLDVSGPAERTGKTRGADLLDGTVTLPLILARQRDPSLARLDLRREAATSEAAAAICDRIAATGALEESRARALVYVSEAKESLRAAGLTAGVARALELVADGVVDRYA